MYISHGIVMKTDKLKLDFPAIFSVPNIYRDVNIYAWPENDTIF